GYDPFMTGRTTAYWLLDKPTIVGESPAKTGQYTVSEMVNNCFINGYGGIMPWSYSANDGAGTWDECKSELKSFRDAHSSIVDYSSTPVVNNPPNIPAQPTGTATGNTDTSYSYYTSATDPDGDQVKYTFDWDDGTTSETALVNSGETGSTSHSWTAEGTYQVKVKATDSKGTTSSWSNALTVLITTIPNLDGNSYNNLDSLEVYPNPFVLTNNSDEVNFIKLPSNSILRIYTLSGKLVRILTGTGNKISWNGNNESKKPI
ncbi:unnamed protein product, partial [marine sediment metagenome]